MGLKMKYSHKNYNVCQFVLCSVRFYFSKKVKVVALQLFSKFTHFWISTPKDRFKIKTWKTKILLTWVLNATTAIIQQQQSKHWKFTFAPTVERNHLSAHSAVIQLLELETCVNITWVILGRNYIIVDDVESHLAKLEIWRCTCSFTPEKNHTSVLNATIQRLKLLIWEDTCQKTMVLRGKTSQMHPTKQQTTDIYDILLSVSNCPRCQLWTDIDASF